MRRYLNEEALISVQARCLQSLTSNFERQTSYAWMSSWTTVLWNICLSTDLFSHIIILGLVFLLGVIKPPNISLSQGLQTKKSAGKGQPSAVMLSITFWACLLVVNVFSSRSMHFLCAKGSIGASSGAAWVAGFCGVDIITPPPNVLEFLTEAPYFNFGNHLKLRRCVLRRYMYLILWEQGWCGNINHADHVDIISDLSQLCCCDRFTVKRSKTV